MNHPTGPVDGPGGAASRPTIAGGPGAESERAVRVPVFARPRVFGLLPLAMALAILALTLAPTRTSELGGAFDCLICGERGVADALLNVLLFAPFGAAVAFSMQSRLRWVLGLAVLLSAGIEVAQVAVPGRHASIGDLLFNAAGAVAGAVLFRSRGRWKRPRRRGGIQTPIRFAGLAIIVLLGTGVLLQPSYPATRYYAQWTPELAHLEPYRGRIESATLGSLSLSPGALAETGVRGELPGEGELRIQASAGPRIERLGSLLSIYDDRRREILLLGPEGDDFVFRYRTRSADLRLDRPHVRMEGAMRGLEPGDDLTVKLRRERGEICLGVNREPACGYGPTLARGWALLTVPPDLPAWAASLLDASWIMALVLPIGYSARRDGATVAAIGLLALGLVFVPPLTGMNGTPPTGFLAASAGVALGVGLRRAVEMRRAAPYPILGLSAPVQREMLE